MFLGTLTRGATNFSVAVRVNQPPRFTDQGNVIKSILYTVLSLAGLSMADLSWSFSSYDQRPGAIGGVYGYVYPATGAGQSSKHHALLGRSDTTGNPVAKMRFHLDGRDFPGAGFGLMFDDAVSLDARSMSRVHVRIRADRTRKVRFSLAPSDSLLKVAADTGVTFGRDTIIGADWVDWTIQAGDLSWPRWATAPAVTRETLLAKVFALQFDVGCEAKDGICKDDSGSVEIDDLELIGAGGRWTDPDAGDCSAETTWIDRFEAGNPKQNDVGGWWYAYTDRTSEDPSAIGESDVLNATEPDSADTWVGPDRDSGASLRFRLVRKSVYSGYATIETQLAQPNDESKPMSRSYTGARAISFQLSFDRDFPASLGGVVVHLRRKGRFFESGRDHQIQIPFGEASRRWCLDLASFKQPTWSQWIEPFSPESLLVASFEVRLPSGLDSASSGFRVSQIALHGVDVTAVRVRASREAGRLVRTSGGWTWTGSTSAAHARAWAVRDPSGRILSYGTVAAGASTIAVPGGFSGIAFLVVEGPGGGSFRLLSP